MVTFGLEGLIATRGMERGDDCEARFTSAGHSTPSPTHIAMGIAMLCSVMVYFYVQRSVLCTPLHALYVPFVRECHHGQNASSSTSVATCCVLRSELNVILLSKNIHILNSTTPNYLFREDRIKSKAIPAQRRNNPHFSAFSRT